jgi:hypothetical protein
MNRYTPIHGSITTRASGVCHPARRHAADRLWPILITDAGFRGAWFRLVNRMGWYWIGRIRNRDMVSPADVDTWAGCKTLYPLATAKAQSLGQYDYVRNHPVPCHLVLIKRTHQGRHKKGKLGKRVHSNQSLKSARAQREPWLLAVCPKLTHLSAQAVVAVYAQRMQIEESFRDLKSERFGLGFSTNRPTQKDRLGVLLLVGCLASFVLRLIGEVGKAKTDGVQIPEQHSSLASGALCDFPRIAACTTWHGSIPATRVWCSP